MMFLALEIRKWVVLLIVLARVIRTLLCVHTNAVPGRLALVRGRVCAPVLRWGPRGGCVRAAVVRELWHRLPARVACTPAVVRRVIVRGEYASGAHLVRGRAARVDGARGVEELAVVCKGYACKEEGTDAGDEQPGDEREGVVRPFAIADCWWGVERWLVGG